MFKLDLSFKEADTIVTALKSERDSASSSAHYYMNQIQSVAGKPFDQCIPNEDGKSYEWRNLEGALVKFNAYDGVLISLFGLDPEPEPSASEYKPPSSDDA
jgi:hypothetical protein